MSNEIKLYLTIETDEEYMELYPLYKNLRTLEHIVELNSGGLHSIYNITMACLSCNSSRKGRNNDN